MAHIFALNCSWSTKCYYFLNWSFDVLLFANKPSWTNLCKVSRSVRVLLQTLAQCTLVHRKFNDENLSSTSWKLEWTQQSFKNETKNRETVDTAESYQTLDIMMGIVLNSVFFPVDSLVLIKDHNIVSWMKQKKTALGNLWSAEIRSVKLMCGSKMLVNTRCFSHNFDF